MGLKIFFLEVKVSYINAYARISTLLESYIVPNLIHTENLE